MHWEPLPNLAQDLIVPPLAQLMPLDMASKLFLVAIFGLIAGGTIWLNRVATGAWRMWPLLAFLLLYNRMFLWGFLNYLFGIGVALAGTALWLALEARALVAQDPVFVGRRARLLSQPYRRLRLLRTGYHRDRAVAGLG